MKLHYVSPARFAMMLRETQDIREASWNDAERRYAKSFHDAASEACHPEWVDIVAITLFPGYADVWDWCDKVAPL